MAWRECAAPGEDQQTPGPDKFLRLWNKSRGSTRELSLAGILNRNTSRFPPVPIARHQIEQPVGGSAESSAASTKANWLSPSLKSRIAATSTLFSHCTASATIAALARDRKLWAVLAARDHGAARSTLETSSRAWTRAEHFSVGRPSRAALYRGWSDYLRRIDPSVAQTYLLGRHASKAKKWKLCRANRPCGSLPRTYVS